MFPQTLTASLTAALLHTLADPANRKSHVIRLTQLLERLHADAAAKHTLLAMRADLARRRVRMIRFEGNTQRYIADLAMVVFTGIKHTADWYLQSFKSNDATSSFVDWAKQQIENYADMFRKQVFSADTDEQTVQECIDITQAQAKKLLQEYGLDFKFLFAHLLVPPDQLPATLDSKHPKVSISLSSFDHEADVMIAPAPALPVRSRDRPPSLSNPSYDPRGLGVSGLR